MMGFSVCADDGGFVFVGVNFEVIFISSYGGFDKNGKH